LPVLGKPYLKAIQRTRGRPLKIQAAPEKAASMAGTFEFILCSKPTGSASQMGAFGKNGIKALFLTYNPNAEILLKLLTDLADGVIGW
jgi:hypothetical protein